MRRQSSCPPPERTFSLRVRPTNSSIRQRRERFMQRRHHPLSQTITPDSGTPAESFEECSTLGVTSSPLSVSFNPYQQQHSYGYGTPPPHSPLLMPPMEAGFLRPPTPFEAGLTKGEPPPHRRVNFKTKYYLTLNPILVK